MSEDKQSSENEKMIEELKELITTRNEFIKRNYPKIRDRFQNEYGWPELDPVRYEICFCLLFGLHQASITLTNHLLESVLKYGLIIHFSSDELEKRSNENVVKAFVEGTKTARDTFGSEDLNKTINLACTEGLITKKQKKHLHFLREKMRNAYGHSDKKKTFGDSNAPFTPVTFENNKFVIEEAVDANLKDMIIGQGIYQAMLAEQDALPYYEDIDDVVRHIFKRVFPNHTDGEEI